MGRFASHVVWRRALPVATWFCVTWVAAARLSAATLYLDFSEGAESIRAGAEDDASQNVSRLCSTDSLLRWDGAADCGDRQSCKSSITELVRDRLREFDVDVTQQRPNGAYTMALIGPGSPGCQFGLLGLSHIDCGNRNPANVLFAYACSTEAQLCANVIVHEFAHAVGLDHVANQADLMSPGLDDSAALAFLDSTAPTLDAECGETTQNSYRSMLNALGPHRDSLDADSSVGGGCTLRARAKHEFAPFAALGLALAWFRRRRVRRG